MKRRIFIICIGLLVGLLGTNNVNAQCTGPPDPCSICWDTLTISQVSCPGGADGFAILTQTPYDTYSWDNITNGQNYGSGAMLISVDTLEAGFYVVTGTTPSGSCPATRTSDTFEILEPIVVHNLNPPTICDSSICNVTDTITIDQQFPGYIYEVSINGGVSQLLPAVDSILCAGSHTYVVSYDTGTTISCPVASFNIAAINLSASINLTDTIKCFGDDATIQVITLGGGGWYKYFLEFEFLSNWYTFSTIFTYDTATFINLPANTYRVTVTDSAGNFTGCQAQVLEIISQPTTELQATFSITNPSLCSGDSVADLHLNVLGGITPYFVSFDGGPNTQISANDTDYINVPAGAYQVIITDANGCTKTRNDTITSPPEMQVNSTISSNYNGRDISCFGENDGAILAQVISSGTPPFQYDLDDTLYVANPSFPNLSSGTYAINYIDSDGCTASDTLTLQDPPDLSGTILESSAITCNSICDGQITFTVDPILIGTPPYQYSLDGGVYQPSATFWGLCSDIDYAITVRDTNGCIYKDSLSLIQPDSLELYVSVVSNYNGWGVSCNGATDGTIFVDSVNGGTPNYTYSLDGGPFGTTTVFTNLSGGLHTIIVQDFIGCRDTVKITISEPSPYSIALTTNVNYNGFDVACNGDCNGSIHVTSTGGVPSYLYSLNGGASQADSNFNLICATMHTVDATDANGCPASDSLLLIEPPVLTLQMDSVIENCLTGDGQAIAIVGGGVTPYFYLWDDPNSQTTSTADSLSTGTYTVIVTDTNSCSIEDSIFVPGTDMILSITSTDVSCNTGSDGTATVTVIGFYASPLVYQWNDPLSQDSSTAIGLTPGQYNVIVTDSNGCFTDTTITVGEPTVVNLELDSANSLFLVPCFGDSVGVASVSATGGTGPGTYWFYIDPVNPQNDSTFYGLPAGNYLIFVTDVNSCIDSVAVQISEPDEIVFTLSSTDAICFGDSTGTAEVASISGGTPPYSYAWSTGATTDSIGGLSIGNYWVTVTDSIGCFIYPPDTVTIGEPTQLTTSVSSTSSMCAGTLANGTAGVVASGGTTPYTYLWSTGATTANINLLVAGPYTVIVTDANSCMAYDTVIVQAGPQPILSVVVQQVSCFGASDGMMTPSATAGTTPYQFSINGGTTWQNPGIQYGPSGQASYFVTVRDSNGCVASDSVFVLEPALLVIDSFSINEVSCYGGSDGEITVNHSGGTPGFTYVWSDGQTTQTATGFNIGNYSVIVIDTNGCVATSSTVTMTEPDSLYIISITSTDVLCNGGNDGTATVTATGGVLPYSYLWSTGDTTQIANVSAGNNSVDVIDLNGCMVSDSIMVNEPAALLVDSFAKNSVFCFGFSDGSATAYVSGGISPYNYLWDNGDNTAFADSLDAGYHTVIITDFNSCEHTDSVQVLQPSAITIDSLIVDSISCKGASNGSIVVLATGGTPFYTYSKDGGNTYQTAIGFIGLSPNTYNIVVKDNNGCEVTTPVTLTEPDSLLIDSVVFHHVSCNGYNNGYIQSINVSGGTPFLDFSGNSYYLYSVNASTPQQYLTSFNNFGPGTYTVQVFDANNCVVAEIIIIEEPQPLNTPITTSTDLPYYHGYGVRCNGGNDGWISVSVSGGVVPYLQTWINAQSDTVQSDNTFSVDSLNAGLYTLVVMDGNTCTTSQFITMTQPTPIQHSFVAIHVTCNGWSNGSITDSIYGGVPGYNYLWNTGDTTHTIDSLYIGWYTMTVTDVNNCISIDSVEINADDSLTANVNDVSDYNGYNVRCYGYCDAWIEVTISGGMPFFDSNGDPIYTNIWDDSLSQITATSIGLCADNGTLSTIYTDTITDAIGCQVIVSETITQPSELEVTASVLDGVSCYSGNNGKLRADATGGTPTGSSYTYDWSTGFSTTGVFSTLSDLGPGSYVVMATDINGCMDTTEIFLAEPTDLSVDVTWTHVSCYGDDNGTITANPTGGTPISPSGTYNYQWDDPNNQTTQTATGLAPGTYQVIVTDDNGCTDTSASVVITQSPSPLIVAANSVNATICGGPDNGEAIGCAFGGTPPYFFSWSNTINGNSSDCHTIYGLSYDTYSVDVTDAMGCTVTASTYVHAVNSIFLPSHNPNWDTIICLNHSASISVVENPDYTYSWAGPDGFSALTPNITVTPGAPTNHYILTITDASCNQSFSITAIVFVTQLPINPVATPNPIKVGDDVEIIATVNGYSNYDWSDENGEYLSNSQSTYVYPEVSTTYYIMVEDAGCQGYDSIRVVVGAIVYNGISPNGDGYNDFWEIEDIDRYPDAVIEVYNRWGSLLFSAKGDTYNDNKWDGTHNGESLPIGTYYYIINLNNNSDLLSGAITIIR